MIVVVEISNMDSNGSGPTQEVMTYKPFDAPLHKEQECIYCLGVGILTVYKISGHLLFKGGLGIPTGDMNYISLNTS